MKKIIIFITIIFLLTNCNSEKSNKTFSGEYKGAWAVTRWNYKFYPNNTFEFESEGHYGNGKSKGTYERRNDSLFLVPENKNLSKYGVVNSLYLIDADSCIIDYRLKFDYCKTRDWSEKRLIKYPQIPTTNSKLITEIEEMLQKSLNTNKLYEQIKDTTQNLIVENYYELNSNYEHQIKIFGQPVIFKSKDEIKSEGIKNYVRIDDINHNQKATDFSIDVIPRKPGERIFAEFELVDNKWKKRKL